jgi:DNA polymerase-3 subunit delta
MDLARGQSLEAALARDAAQIGLVLLYGPDPGLAHERARAALKAVGADPNDAFRVSRIEAASLNDDPARLPDEAASLTFTGERRVVWIADVTDAHGGGAIAEFLTSPIGDALIIVEAGDLPSKSALRAAAKASPKALSVPCYLDSDADIASLLRSSLKDAGIAVSADALRYLTDHLGSNRLVSRGEIDKLILYAGAGARIELEDAIASVGDNAQLSVQDVIMACASGEAQQLQRKLAQAFRDGETSVGMIRQALRHFQRLQLVSIKRSNGMSAKDAVGSLQPRPFFKEIDALVQQSQLWSAAKLKLALSRLLEAEISCKATGLPDETMAGHLFFDLAGLVRRTR